jgi:hypothetical protein
MQSAIGIVDSIEEKTNMTETTPDNNAQQLLELQRARRTVRLMAQGMMPGYEIVKAADEAVRDAIGSDPEARKAFRASSKVLGYIKMGVAPAHQYCLEAEKQIESLIERLSICQALKPNESIMRTSSPKEI